IVAMNGSTLLADEANGNSLGDKVFQAESVKDVQSSLSQLSEGEASVTTQLDALIVSQRDLSRGLWRIDLLRAQVGSQALSTRSIRNSLLSDASFTASKISGAIKSLDLEQARVKSTLDIVEQVAELKACVLGVTGSMGAPQDWETAAGYLNRASKIPMEIVNGSFAEEIIPTAEVPDPASVTLEHAAESLCELFLREFEKAAQEGHGGKVTRFFKLFPLIGKPEVGLSVYGRYVCQGVASRARANLNAGIGGARCKEGFFYANALTKLFEHIAQIVENHGGLVKRHYGAGRMVKVIERLQKETDVQGGIILDTWRDERSIDRRLTDIRSYAFTFLVQSFLATTPARSSTPRAESPRTRRSVAENQSRDDESTDMKEIDGNMSEMALMLGRWSLYSSFIAAKCGEPKTVKEGMKLPVLLSNSSLRHKIGDRVVAPFNTMTTFFLRKSVEKAFQLEEQPPDLSLDHRKPIPTNPPYITSAVDDVMYIVDQTVERSLATSQRAVVSSVIPTVARVLGSDFIGMVQRKMRDETYPKATVQGALPPEQITIAFLVLINNLDVARDYIKRIVQSRIGQKPNEPFTNSTEATTPLYLANLFPLDDDAAFALNALKSLQSSFDGKASELIGDGIFVIFKNIMKPRLRPLLADAFRDVDYQMTQEDQEEVNAAAEAGGRNHDLSDAAVQDRFQQGWDILTKPVIRLLTEPNFERLLTLMIAHLGEMLEKRIWSYYGRLADVGAVRLERDIASIVSVVVRDGKYGLRESFVRCTQICIVMNMEEDEWDEVQGPPNININEGIKWQLDSNERLRARAMVHSKKQ
ncbi:MAG: hypothetical protein Q9217_007006, partial [Psora testacea]